MYYALIAINMCKFHKIVQLHKQY